MNIGIVGSSGYIGKYLLKALEHDKFAGRVVKFDHNEYADRYLDLQEPEVFDYDCLDDIDFIVFAAAISGPDRCASDFDFCWKINVTGTKYFIGEAVRKKCKVLFFSSDSVFGDIPGKIFDENSETKAETPYGRMKKDIEDAFREEPCFKAIRLSYVASRTDKFISYCLNCIQNGETATIFHPFYRNVVVASDVVNVVFWLLQHWDAYSPFALNIAGKELVSRVRIADELNRIFKDKLKYIITAPDEGFYKNRPKITQMKSLYMQEYDILKDSTFTEKINREFSGTNIQ